MIKSVTVVNYLGESVKITLADENPEHGFLLKSVTGIGASSADISTTSLATADGSVFNSSRIGERNIVINLLFDMAPNIESTRKRTYKYFPVKRPVDLIFEEDNHTIKTAGYVESNEPDIFSKQEGCTISILCPDPFFYAYGPDEITETIFYGIEPLFEFEFENNSLDEPLIEFGEISDMMERNIYYEGDTEIGVRITIHAMGPASNVAIYNTGTREIMRINTSEKLLAMTGEEIVEGDDIIIDTTRGHKTITLIRDGYKTNILNCLQRGSDWFQLSKGDNIFAYTADFGSENLQFKIQNQTSYEGV